MALIEVGNLNGGDKDAINVIATREHIIYASRKKQLAINELGFYGGRPYVDSRLSRFTGESSIDWEGGYRDGDGSKITGRKDQSYVTNHLGRICDKINQYVFSIEPIRTGIQPEIESKISSEGLSLNRFMIQVSSNITVSKWCWIGIDSPETDLDQANIQLSLADKESLQIRPYWKLYTALQVPDWYIDSNGELQWIITEGTEYIANDPLIKAQVFKVRRLWTKTGITKVIYDPNDLQKVKYMQVSPMDMAQIPFVLVNETSAYPYSFDNLESINRTLMDLSSVNRANYFKSCYPQLYLPASVLDSVMNAYGINADAATKKLMGWNYPILVGVDDKEPGYIMPDGNTIGKMREEINQLKEEMFENVGLLMRKSTKQAESAEAKSWDNVDLQAVMKERAMILEEAEKKAVMVSNEIDPDFGSWTPEYNRKFAVTNFEAEVSDMIIGPDKVEVKEETVEATEEGK